MENEVMKDVLVLGTGLVSKPLVVYLLEKGFQVKIASRTVKKACILILNEIGLDPGIDHMSAMRIIHDVENRLVKGEDNGEIYRTILPLPIP